MPQDFIDLIRISHLFFFALGMGAGLYFDVRALRRINTAFTQDDIAGFNQVHNFVVFAVFGLWITGIMMIYIRTGFNVSEFTPKLWMKLIVVTVLTANAFSIGRIVLPRVAQSVGQKAIELPLRTILTMTTATAFSVFCWLSGLVLGVSVTLKTADWTTLSGFLIVEFFLIVSGGLALVLFLRSSINRRSKLDDGLVRGR